MSTRPTTVSLTHSRVTLALHELRAGDGRPLLLLHELGGRSPEQVPAELAAWPGPVHALDFTGHGQSTVPRGGGYHPEILMADADAGLAHLGEATVVGWGLGGYVALLIAGGRPTLVRGVVICDGAGLAGGGPVPVGGPRVTLATPSPAAPDPFAVAELSDDLRPPDYAAVFARVAAERSGLETPVTVCAGERPPWLVEVLAEAGVRRSSGLAEAVSAYAPAP